MDQSVTFRKRVYSEITSIKVLPFFKKNYESKKETWLSGFREQQNK